MHMKVMTFEVKEHVFFFLDSTALINLLIIKPLIKRYILKKIFLERRSFLKFLK